MKTKSKVAVILGIAAVAVGGFLLYKRNLKKISKDEARKKSEFRDLGVDVDKLNADAVNVTKDNDEYGDIRRFSDLPYPQQLVRLLNCSSNWSDEDLDWTKVDGYNSIHVVFKEHKEEYLGTNIGFFIEVPPLLGGPRNNLRYKDYTNFLNHLTQDFWAREKVECTRPRSTDVVGLYSRFVEAEVGGKTINILQYSEIPEKTLKKRSRYHDRLDGLYSYYSEAKREEERGVYDIIPNEMEDIHLFMGVWFRLETPSRSYGGITMRQVLKFLEELVLKDDYVIEDSNHENQQTLGPVIVHPGIELEYILGPDLKVYPIEQDTEEE